MLGPFASRSSGSPRASIWRKSAGRTPEIAESDPRSSTILHSSEEAVQSPSPSTTLGAVSNPVEVGGVRVGGGTISWMAGPAYVESVDQMIEAASTLSEFGARFLRARAYWPDAKVSDFQRHLHSGLKLLHSTAKHFDLKVVSEITSINDLQLLDKYCDAIEVPAELASDYRLLRALGSESRTVIFNRHPMMSVERYLTVLESLERGGRANIIIAENGMRSFDPFTTSLLDLSSLVHLRRERPHPILVNCSVLAERAEQTEDLAVAAIAGGADGILAEISTGERRSNPKALLPTQLEGVMQRTNALKYTLNALARHKYSST